MPTRLDHVIVLGRDLTQLEAAFTRMGFWVTGGGTHPHLGTKNRIIILDEGYIELLTIADPAVASSRLAERLASQLDGGWVGFAVQSDAIDDEVAEMRERGVDVRGPTVGRLVAPNGTARGWRVATVGATDLWDAAEPLPFLIQHEATGAQHRAELAGAEGEAPHANGALRLAGVTIATPDLAALSTRFAQTYALTLSGAVDTTATGDVPSPAALGAQTLALPLAAGHETIILAQPTQDGLARERLQSAGEGVCMITLAVGDLSAARLLLGARGVSSVTTDHALLITGPDSANAPLCFVAAG